MNARLFTWGLAALTAHLLLVLPSWGQAPSNGDTATLQTQIGQLQQAVENLTRVTVTKQDLEQFVSRSEFAERTERVDGRFDALVGTLADQSAQISNLQSDFQKVTDNLFRQMGEQREILEAISQPTGDGSHVLALRSNMQQNPAFRQEVEQAVHDSIRRSGTLEVQNNMDVGKYLQVNGREWYIPARSERTFEVPVGTLTTELVGDEAPRSFAVGPPGYLQRIEINPRRTVQMVQRPVVEMPVERTVLQSPVYTVERPVEMPVERVVVQSPVYTIAPLTVWYP